MSTNLSELNLDDWISQANAAKIRGVTRQAIAKLIRRKRLKTMEIDGRKFVRRTDIQNFKEKKPGRPKV